MPFSPSSSLFQKNNARNIIYMAVLIFLKCLDLRKNVYSRTTSLAYLRRWFWRFLVVPLQVKVNP
jgi:hypothetical protein